MQHMHPTRQSSSKSGFTIVELLVVTAVLGIIITVLFYSLIIAYREVSTLNDVETATKDLYSALWYFDDSVRVSNTFLMSVPSPYTDPYGPHNIGSSGGEAWSYKGDSSTSRVLMTKSYATSANLFGTGRGPVYAQSVTYNCTTQLHYQPQLSYVSIFFLRNSTLYKRILTDTTTTLCPGNSQFQKQSCPPYISRGTWNPLCLTQDEVLANNISEFKVGYYQTTSAGTGIQIDPTYTATDPSTLDAADYVIVTLTSSIRGGVKTKTVQQQMTKVNQ